MLSTNFSQITRQIGTQTHAEKCKKTSVYLNSKNLGCDWPLRPDLASSHNPAIVSAPASNLVSEDGDHGLSQDSPQHTSGLNPDDHLDGVDGCLVTGSADTVFDILNHIQDRGLPLEMSRPVDSHGTTYIFRCDSICRIVHLYWSVGHQVQSTAQVVPKLGEEGQRYFPKNIRTST